MISTRCLNFESKLSEDMLSVSQMCVEYLSKECLSKVLNIFQCSVLWPTSLNAVACVFTVKIRLPCYIKKIN